MDSRREKEQDKIKEEAKQILDKFAKALARIEKVPDSFVEREEDRREEGKGERGDSEFQKFFFENAPSTKKECIEAEKGKWK